MLAGLCVVCGGTPVKNRATCYSCIDKQVSNQNRYGFRKILAQHGLTKGEYDQLIDDLDSAMTLYEFTTRESCDKLRGLFSALLECKYK